MRYVSVHTDESNSLWATNDFCRQPALALLFDNDLLLAKCESTQGQSRAWYLQLAKNDDESDKDSVHNKVHDLGRCQPCEKRTELGTVNTIQKARLRRRMRGKAFSFQIEARNTTQNSTFFFLV